MVVTQLHCMFIHTVDHSAISVFLSYC